MEIKNINSVNFNGYKNVLSNTVIRPKGAAKMTFLSMQLDNIGKNDLEIWQRLQKHITNRDFTTDIITFNLIEQGGKNTLAVSDALIRTENIEPRSEEEKLMIDAYTLAASLTDRIKQDFRINYDENYRAMAYETRADLTDFFSGFGVAELNRAVFGAYYQDNQQSNATYINDKITEIMLEYFA